MNYREAPVRRIRTYELTKEELVTAITRYIETREGRSFTGGDTFEGLELSSGVGAENIYASPALRVRARFKFTFPEQK